MDKRTSNNLKSILENSPELNACVEGLKSAAQAVDLVLKPYILKLQKFVETPDFQNFLKELQLTHTLFRAGDKFWVIEDRELLKILSTKDEDKYSQVITEYYLQNNYAKLGDLIKNWTDTSCINERLSIINDCYETMQKLDNKQAANNLVIPTLLAQMTGITECLHALVPEDIRKEINKELTLEGKQPSKGMVTSEYLWRNEPNRDVYLCYYVIFNTVMKNTSKKTSFTDEELETYNKYRNKILHGDIQFLNYGTDENLIRTWLELNIVIKVYSIYKDYKPKESDNE